MLFVERTTRCITAWRVLRQTDEAAVQAMLEEGVQAQRYYSDRFPGYESAIYFPGQKHVAMNDKSQTYSVEGVNADLRHYLARLHRRSRCFLRALYALRDAIRLFVYAHNRRQLYRWLHPDYPAPLMAFV
jgi:IS1 family transposase